MSKIKHVLGISGGKDSAALAIYMRDHYPELEIEYFFTDTGKELDEVYEYLSYLEGYLGKPVQHINPDRDFDFWLTQHNDYLPSPQARWCTIKMKLKPFQDWVQGFLDEGYEVHSYVAIRADEPYRTGYDSSDEKLVIKLPFREDGIDKPGVMDILENSGVGLPSYYEWRTRSGCTFCFFQRKIEWVGLLERHPEAFKEAMLKMVSEEYFNQNFSNYINMDGYVCVNNGTGGIIAIELEDIEFVSYDANSHTYLYNAKIKDLEVYNKYSEEEDSDVTLEECYFYCEIYMKNVNDNMVIDNIL